MPYVPLEVVLNCTPILNATNHRKRPSEPYWNRAVTNEERRTQICVSILPSATTITPTGTHEEDATVAAIAASVTTAMTERDLKSDLNLALRDLESKARTEFCHYSTHTHIPLPGLDIDGFGLVGLPLTARDAVSIIRKATAGPLGTGTWEVLPERMTVRNPEWSKFVDRLVETRICPQFGLLPEVVRCELDKLVLCQQGSRFDNQTESSPGTFAALTIILPSDFQGGELRVSYAGPVAVCDPSQDSRFNTTCIAWYTEGTSFEASPLTSGRSLSLCYNLIHVPHKPEDLPPSLPNMTQAVIPLHDILLRWKRWQYCPSGPLVLGYLLENHQYDESGQLSPMQLLSDADRKFLHYFLGTAQQLGIAVGIAQLVYGVTGYPKGYDRERKKWYDEDHSDSDPDGDTPIEEIELDWMAISKCSPLGRTPLEAFPSHRTKLELDLIVQGNDYFKSKDKDGWEFIPDSPIGPHLDHRYYRTVLILRVDENDLKHVIDELYSIVPSNPPSSRAKELAFYILAHLDLNNHNNRKKEPFKPPNFDVRAHLYHTWFLLYYVLCCRYLELWNKVFPHLWWSKTYNYVGPAIQMGLQVFDQGAILPGIAKLMRGLEVCDLGTCIPFYCAIEAAAQGRCTVDWLYRITKDTLDWHANIMAGAGNPSIEYIQAVLWFARRWGLENVVCNIIIPSLSSTRNSYRFLSGLARQLHEHCNQGQWVCAPPGTLSVQDTINRCVSTAVEKQCTRIFQILECVSGSNSEGSSVPTSASGDTYTVYTDSGIVRVNRWTTSANSICQMVDLCLSVQDMDSCARLFVRLLKWLVDTILASATAPTPTPAAAPSTTATTSTGSATGSNAGLIDKVFNNLYIPLILLLKQVLRKHQISTTEPPFVGFLKSVTELYLLCVLGDRSSVSEDTWETRQNTAKSFLEACFCPSGGQDEEEEEEGEEGEEREEKEEEKEEGEDDEEKEGEDGEGEDEGEEEWTEEEAKELKMIMGERYDDLWDAVNGVKAYTLTA